jgi:hypothetical protein
LKFCAIFAEMGKKIIIFNIALMSVILLTQTTMNICSLHSLTNAEYVVEATIYVVEDSHEEDNLSINNNTACHPTLRQYRSNSLSPYAISGISPSVWQPPE